MLCVVSIDFKFELELRQPTGKKEHPQGAVHTMTSTFSIKTANYSNLSAASRQQKTKSNFVGKPKGERKKFCLKKFLFKNRSACIRPITRMKKTNYMDHKAKGNVTKHLLCVCNYGGRNVPENNSSCF